VTPETSWHRKERELAVVDLGSNTFRLVVYHYEPGVHWRRTDEIYEPVRIGAGMAKSGKLGAKRMTRAFHTLDTYAHFLRARGIGAGDQHFVATSAIRDATNREEFLEQAAKTAGVAIRVLAREEEARYGYIAAVNSTTLSDGAVLDLGGGSLQLTSVRNRHARELASWPLGTVRMTERFLADGGPAAKKDLKALRAHITKELAGAPWLADSGARLVGIGGTLRNLADAALRAAGLPDFGIQGYVINREALGELVEQLAALPSAERGSVNGIKPERGDVILAGAATIEAVLDAGGFEAVEATEAGLREGVLFETHLAPLDPPLFDDVRTASVRNLAAQYEVDPPHVDHVARLSLAMFDALAQGGVHSGDRVERELLWAASMLHDVGMAVDYDDHHKHSRYLILNAGLPGFSLREVALIAQMTRYHRKGSPAFGDLSPLTEKGDEAILNRGAALLRLAESLERSRDQLVRSARVAVDDGAVSLKLVADEDTSVARWAAERQVDLFERAFGRSLEIVG
jgi:exopolyphosphatase/guanosine-5'-triphosphate,3'-diphosphate pyrophosphatase